MMLLLPVLLIPRISGTLCVSSKPQAQTLENVQPTIRRACHHVGNIGKVRLLPRGAETHISTLTAPSRAWNAKGAWRCGCRADTGRALGRRPVTAHSSLVPSPTVSRHQHAATDESSHGGWILPAREKPRFQWRKTAVVFSRAKNDCLFQDSINKRKFPFFSKKYFPFKAALKFKLPTLVTPFTTGPAPSIQASTCRAAGVPTLPGDRSPGARQPQSVSPTSVRNLNWP